MYVNVFCYNIVYQCFSWIYIRRDLSSGLTNDHKALMKKIEEGLHKVHSLAESNESPQTASDAPNSREIETMEPFLRVNLVSPGSPAENAVWRLSIYLF